MIAKNSRLQSVIAISISFAVLLLPAGQLWADKRSETASVRHLEEPLYIDVREFEEFITGHVPSALNIPLEKLKGRLAELEAYKDREIVAVCAVGQRSAEAAKTLTAAGFRARNFLGGMKAWVAEEKPVNGRMVLPYFSDGIGALLQAVPVADAFNPHRGILVRTISVGGAAEHAGLQMGDIITAINGKAADAEALLKKYLFRDFFPGVDEKSRLEASVFRAGKPLKVSIDPNYASQTGERFSAAQKIFADSSGEVDAMLVGKLTGSDTLSSYSGMIDGMKIFLKQWGATALPSAGYILTDPQQVSKVPGLLIPELKEEFDLSQVMRSALRLSARELGLDENVLPLHDATLPNLKPKDLSQLFSQVEAALIKNERSSALVLQHIANEDRGFLALSAQRFFTSLTTLKPLLTQAQDEESLSGMFRFREVARKYDLQPMLDAVQRLGHFTGSDYLRSIQTMLAQTAALSANKEPGLAGEVLGSRSTQHGRIVIGGAGKNIYTGKFAAIIDLGGNDEYRYSSDYAPVLLIDFSGDDIHDYKETFSAKSLNSGARLLYDLSGADSYKAADYAFGSAAFGVSIHLDGTGDDRYKSKTFSQGAAAFGIGLLIDGLGDDFYEAQASSQGFGSPGGVGILIDRAGNDRYDSSGSDLSSCPPCTFTQGAGYGVRTWLYGGIGMLFDLNGNDSYSSKDYAQGLGYEGSLGLLYDRSGDDRYSSGKFGAAAGVHKAIGVLYDQSGNDTYDASDIRAQGSAWDLGVAYLLDGAGDDSYTAKQYSQGAGSANSYALLLDLSGRDKYYCDDKSSCQGYGMPEKPEGGKTVLRRSIGVLLDGGSGMDAYSSEGLRNGFKRDKSGVGFFEDY